MRWISSLPGPVPILSWPPASTTDIEVIDSDTLNLTQTYARVRGRVYLCSSFALAHLLVEDFSVVGFWIGFPGVNVSDGWVQ
jgi:hypothetical protein